MARILIADNDPNCRSTLRELLEPLGHQVCEAEDGKKAVSTACSFPLDIIILDAGLPKFHGTRGIKTLREECTELAILVMSDSDLTGTAIAAMKLGAFDYAVKPLNPDEVVQKTDRALERCRLISRNRYLLGELDARFGLDHPIGHGPTLREAHSLAEQFAKSDGAVLIHGEKGTGKEHLARSIHRLSKRADGPFVKFTCLPEPGSSTQVDLFGMDARASGDLVDRIGHLDLAAGGAIFLNEIAHLNTAIQDMLLPLLQEKQFVRVGGVHAVPSDVRFFAASSEDLAQATEEGSFRSELYRVLSKSIINLPPLRDRPEDIPALVDFFVKKHALETGKSISSVADAAIEQILSCEWSGNITELENCIERSVIVCDCACIQPAHLVLNGGRSSAKRKQQGHIKSLREVERDHIKRVLIYCNWNRSAAAGILEIDRKTLRSKIREFGFTTPPER